MKVWITKYALTAGIKELDVGEPDENGLIFIKGRLSYFHGDGREWHRTRESAVANARSMQSKKIAALKRQLAALEAKRFE